MWRQEALKQKGLRGGSGSWDSYLPLFVKAQKRVERRHYRQRVDLMLYEKQRQEKGEPCAEQHDGRTQEHRTRQNLQKSLPYQ